MLNAHQEELVLVVAFSVHNYLIFDLKNQGLSILLVENRYSILN